jgi:uncharacterized membrane protein YgdD (TMEM256/DUF423 family)
MKMTRNRISGIFGTVWGGAILASKMSSTTQASQSSAYAAGQTIGLVFGIILFCGGLYYLIKG